MISIFSLIKEVITPSQEYQERVNDIIDQGGEYLGSGDYGSVYQVGDKVKKVTSDEVEIEHAEILKGKSTQYFVPIIDVEVVNPKLAIITMPNMKPFTGKVPDEFIAKLNKEASEIGIDPEELDIRPDNFMLDSQGNLKMTDV
jgi:serine/threonine protein kinase